MTTELSSFRAFDIGCGIGGLSIGAVQAGFQVAGVDCDRRAAAVYEDGVGPVSCLDVSEVHAPWTALHVVMSDLPPAKGRFGQVPVEAGRGSFAWHVVRVAVEVHAPVVLLLYPNNHNTAPFGDLLGEAGYYPRPYGGLNVSDLGVPQHRGFDVILGFRSKTLAGRWRWPKRTHTHPKYAHDDKKEKWRRVVDVLPKLPFEEPSPSISSTEYRSAWRGYRGGRASRCWRASETIAHVVGKARWLELGRTRVALSPEELLALQGMPAWHLHYSRFQSTRLVGQCTPPAISRWVLSSLRRMLRTV